MPAITPSRAILQIRSPYAPSLSNLTAGAISTPSLTQAFAALQNAHPNIEDRLRVLRQLVLERLYTQDIEQGAALDVVMHGMSVFADFAVTTAQAHTYSQLCAELDAKIGTQQRHPAKDGLWLLGMGKLGARELNVSSDIDLIAVYDSAGVDDLDTHHFYCEQVKRIHQLLHEESEHGFVFRVDWMLRPYGRDGQWATPLHQLTQYFAKNAREWERFAWLKSRVLGEQKPLALRDTVRRFVFRRFLDHKVFVSLRDLHALIRANASGDKAWRDVKLGRGGIREIEFAAQVQQIVRGGQEPELLTRTTLGALTRLEKADLMSQGDVQTLSAAYDFLRRLEHRIQYLDDAQTHDLPTNAEDQAWVASSMGFAAWDALQGALDKHRSAVAYIFEQWVSDTKHASSVTPEVVSRIAPWTMNFLRRHPDVADVLRQPELLKRRFDPELFKALLTARHTALLQTGLCDEESLMDVLRRAQKTALFTILVQDIQGMLSVRDVADDLSALADACIQTTLLWAWAFCAKRHVDSPQMAVIAYGKLGGKELGYGSDLDVVFVYDDAQGVAHEDAADNYTRLVRKFTTWMSAKTAEGDLYEIDTALRPNGNSGLLVTSVTSFSDYQLGRGANTAWTWEHQAMCRARVCAALHASKETAAALQALLGEVRKGVLSASRDRQGLQTEVFAMRDKLHTAYAPKTSAQFDIKHSSGGLLDVEFAVQFLVLAYANNHPAMLDNVGNIELLRRAELAGLLPAGVGFAAADAYTELRALQHATRLQGLTACVDFDLVQTKKIPQAVKALWDCLFGQLTVGTATTVG